MREDAIRSEQKSSKHPTADIAFNATRNRLNVARIANRKRIT
tara:strand:+ start:271 stop:396 length:126 start_codon:yes stop_codon:yes gene_type:complete